MTRTTWPAPAGPNPDALYKWAQEMLKELRKGSIPSSGDFGTMATQDADAVDITGGTIDGVTITDSTIEGYVVGPAASTDMAVALFDGITGELLQNSAITVDADGNVTIEGDDNVLRLVGPANVGIDLGNVDGSGGLTFIDFHTGTTPVDYDVRLIASGGTGASGNGALNIAAATLQHNSVDLLTEDYSPIIADTVQAATSGTAIDFSSLPAAIKRITVTFDAVSSSGSSGWLVQIGDSGGLETTGYTSMSSNRVNDLTSTSGFVMRIRSSAELKSGHMILTRITGNTWVASHVTTGVDISCYGGGRKDLTADLDRLRITTVNGTDTFDAAGQINIMYEL